MEIEICRLLFLHMLKYKWDIQMLGGRNQKKYRRVLLLKSNSRYIIYLILTFTFYFILLLSEGQVHFNRSNFTSIYLVLSPILDNTKSFNIKNQVSLTIDEVALFFFRSLTSISL